jgi:hypothetical protein
MCILSGFTFSISWVASKVFKGCLWLGFLLLLLLPKANSPTKWIIVIQSHSQRQVLPSTNLKAPQTLLSPALGSKNYPPATHYAHTVSAVRFFSPSFPPAMHRYLHYFSKAKLFSFPAALPPSPLPSVSRR